MNTDINALTCFTLSTTAQVAHLVLNKPEGICRSQSLSQQWLLIRVKTIVKLIC